MDVKRRAKILKALFNVEEQNGFLFMIDAKGRIFINDNDTDEELLVETVLDDLEEARATGQYNMPRF